MIDWIGNEIKIWVFELSTDDQSIFFFFFFFKLVASKEQNSACESKEADQSTRWTTPLPNFNISWILHNLKISPPFTFESSKNTHPVVFSPGKPSHHHTARKNPCSLKPNHPSIKIMTTTATTTKISFRKKHPRSRIILEVIRINQSRAKNAKQYPGNRASDTQAIKRNLYPNKEARIVFLVAYSLLLLSSPRLMANSRCLKNLHLVLFLRAPLTDLYQREAAPPLLTDEEVSKPSENTRCPELPVLLTYSRPIY